MHKPFDSLTILTLMSASGASSGRRHLINAAYATVIPLGVVLYLFVWRHSGGESSQFLGRSLGFAAGTFLCIATSDLLPELQFHSHDRFKLSLALVLGLGSPGAWCMWKPPATTITSMRLPTNRPTGMSPGTTNTTTPVRRTLRRTDRTSTRASGRVELPFNLLPLSKIC